IFSAMGFYPVNPVGGEYETGVPLFEEILLHLENGKTFTVKRHNGTTSKTTLNGTPLESTSITHNDIMRGGTLEFFVKD
ncbi:MAG: glycoside hydrolase family 92 protein, partial [Bacteroidaceae bacterium]|nr:glycoside hydrolase family 92 protein [Bacteroidaceae bacterium]